MANITFIPAVEKVIVEQEEKFVFELTREEADLLNVLTAHVDNNAPGNAGLRDAFNSNEDLEPFDGVGIYNGNFGAGERIWTIRVKDNR